MATKTFDLTLASSPSSITKVEPYLEKIAAGLGLNEDQMNKLMVSVTEAVNNAIVHGNKQDPKKKVSVTSNVEPGWLVVVIRDQGKGFDPKSLRNPLKDENLMLTNGRGVFLMRSLMDKVEVAVEKEGTVVKLWLDLDQKE